jgi:hypothetical protein
VSSVPDTGKKNFALLSTPRFHPWELRAIQAG